MLEIAINSAIKAPSFKVYCCILRTLNMIVLNNYKFGPSNEG